MMSSWLKSSRGWIVNWLGRYDDERMEKTGNRNLLEPDALIRLRGWRGNDAYTQQFRLTGAEEAVPVQGIPDQVIRLLDAATLAQQTVGELGSFLDLDYSENYLTRGTTPGKLFRRL